ncbi:hypothetical protein BB561_001696 [Smittium simulii]|uniref:Uncharacterized protein n=1 Tax=Smittium simulii TaxID=133385 RepID=A0A2T9YTD8_9FUNG|nr:hypothetical protein BB561_001696 [Smittium simulii]
MNSYTTKKLLQDYNIETLPLNKIMKLSFLTPPTNELKTLKNQKDDDLEIMIEELTKQILQITAHIAIFETPQNSPNVLITKQLASKKSEQENRGNIIRNINKQNNQNLSLLEIEDSLPANTHGYVPTDDQNLGHTLRLKINFFSDPLYITSLKRPSIQLD